LRFFNAIGNAHSTILYNIILMKKIINGITIECVKGDIAAQDEFTAVVNAANAELMSGGGVAGALHRAAGKGLAQECRALAPIKPGQAVITAAFNLPNKFVIHCLGPVYGRDNPSDKLLSACYRNALDLAEKNNIDSIAFPAISAGVFGYPMADAAQVAFATIIQKTPYLKKVKKIRFVLYNNEYLAIHEKVLAGLT